MGSDSRRKLISTVFVAGLVLLALLLGFLQYRWIGEVSRAEQARLQSGLQAGLNRLSHQFNTEFSAAVAALTPDSPDTDAANRRAEYAARAERWLETAVHPRMFRTIALATPHSADLVLTRFDAATGRFEPAEWPEPWHVVRTRLREKVSGAGVPGPVTEDQPWLFEVPGFAPRRSGPGPGELEWLLLELDPAWLHATFIPELLRRNLGEVDGREFDAEIVMADFRDVVVYHRGESRIGRRADATVRLFEPMRRPGFFGGRGMRGPRGRSPEVVPGGTGRWLLSVRHPAGSLEALVERSRKRNLALTGVLLLLLAGAVAALVTWTRRAQRLARLQMQFVAGVSHELRTPLSVMRTAGHNLRQGRVAADPLRVQQYGELIEQESTRLANIVEQVLRFANSDAGRTIASAAPVTVETVIEEAAEADRTALADRGCVIRRRVEPGLPQLLGDANSLRHAIQNLIDNAARYGPPGGLIDVTAGVNQGSDGLVVEIRVRDQGPGIPPDEIGQIFDPFFRGSRAVRDQIHGTGLGLSLAKRIVEAHGGTLGVNSAPGQGTEFIVRIPAMAPDRQHEPAHSAH